MPRAASSRSRCCRPSCPARCPALPRARCAAQGSLAGMLPGGGSVTLGLPGRRGPCRSLGCWGGRRGHAGLGLGGARGRALRAGGLRAGGGRQPAAGTRSPRPLPPSAAAGSGGAGTRTPRALRPPAARRGPARSGAAPPRGGRSQWSPGRAGGAAPPGSSRHGPGPRERHPRCEPRTASWGAAGGRAARNSPGDAAGSGSPRPSRLTWPVHQGYSPERGCEHKCHPKFTAVLHPAKT
ncbi:uncharacterized protein LOC141730457 [Zonotrichia albicollis]|uniref:uncharacterized protein LOC141730457 n=1 Tax=Zonotrichia albicollis TaxID=44394 RepID=UPI003D80BB9C